MPRGPSPGAGVARPGTGAGTSGAPTTGTRPTRAPTAGRRFRHGCAPGRLDRGLGRIIVASWYPRGRPGAGATRSPSRLPRTRPRPPVGSPAVPLTLRSPTTRRGPPGRQGPAPHRAGPDGGGRGHHRGRLRADDPGQHLAGALRPGAAPARASWPWAGSTHLANRVFVPDANAVVMPMVFLLNGLGYVMISRIDLALCHVSTCHRATRTTRPCRRPGRPAGWPLYVLTLAVVRRSRDLDRYRYLLLAAGVVLLLLPARPRPRAQHPGRPPVDPDRLLRVPAGGDRQDRPLHLLRLLLRRQARAAHHPDRPPRQPAGPRPPAAGPHRAGLGVRHPRDEPRARHRVLGPAVRPVHRPAVGHHRPDRLPACSASCCSPPGPTSRASTSPRPTSGWRTGSTRGVWPTAAATSSSSPGTRSGSGGIGGTGLGLGQAAYEVPNSNDRLHLRRDRRGDGPARAPPWSWSPSCCWSGAGLRIAQSARSEFAKLVATGLTIIIGFQAFFIIGGIVRLLPAHRHHPALHLLRRLGPHRQLRAGGPAHAHLRRGDGGGRRRRTGPVRARTWSDAGRLLTGS